MRSAIPCLTISSNYGRAVGPDGAKILPFYVAQIHDVDVDFNVCDRDMTMLHSRILVLAKVKGWVLSGLGEGFHVILSSDTREGGGLWPLSPTSVYF